MYISKRVHQTDVEIKRTLIGCTTYVVQESSIELIAVNHELP